MSFNELIIIQNNKNSYKNHNHKMNKIINIGKIYFWLTVTHDFKLILI